MARAYRDQPAPERFPLPWPSQLALRLEVRDEAGARPAVQRSGAKAALSLTKLDQVSLMVDPADQWESSGQVSMSTTLNLYQAKTQLSKLVERAAAGEEIVIAKAGKPMARLVPFARPKPVRKPGFLKGQVQIADDFDEWPADILASFEASIEPPG